MKCRCDGCAKFFDTKQYAFYCDDCADFFEETPVIDDSNCHCGPCTAMNEPLTLEGDIRYLKAHIKTKNRQLAEKDNALAEAKLRIDVYREAWQDAERESARLREENERLKRAVEISVEGHTQTDKKYVELAHENKKLREQNETLKTENDKIYHINCGINHRVSVLEQQAITLEGHKARYQEEILQLEQEAETYRIALNRISKIAQEVGLE